MVRHECGARADTDVADAGGSEKRVKVVLVVFIQGARGFIEESEFWQPQKEAREGDALLLAQGENVGPIQHAIEITILSREDISEVHLSDGGAQFVIWESR